MTTIELCYGMDVPHRKGLHPDQCASCGPEPVNNDGLVQVGEITTRVMREALQEPDFQHARRGGATQALTDCLAWVGERIAAAGPYDDTRALQEMVIWLGDKIREVNDPNQIGSEGG